MEGAALCLPTWLESGSGWLEACFANGFFQPLPYKQRSITVPSRQQQLQDEGELFAVEPISVPAYQSSRQNRSLTIQDSTD